MTFTVLYLLQCFKACFPATKGSSSLCLFISAFILASKIICDDTYSNKSWCIIGQGMFALWKINQMEQETPTQKIQTLHNQGENLKGSLSIKPPHLYKGPQHVSHQPPITIQGDRGLWTGLHKATT